MQRCALNDEQTVMVLLVLMFMYECVYSFFYKCNGDRCNWLGCSGSPALVFLHSECFVCLNVMYSLVKGKA